MSLAACSDLDAQVSCQAPRGPSLRHVRPPVHDGQQPSYHHRLPRDQVPWGDRLPERADHPAQD